MSKTKAFEPIKLLNGETRSAYMDRRIGEGADDATIAAEINAADLYSGTPGKKWPRNVVHAARLRVNARLERDEPRAAVTDDPDEPAAPRTPIDELQLDEAEREEIRAEAYRKVAAERKKALRDELLRQEMDKLRAVDGMRTGNPRLDELVTIMLDLPEGNNSIIINHKPYWGGQPHTVPRHVAETMADTQFQLWKQMARNDGKPVDFYTKSHVDRRTGHNTAGILNDKIGAGDVGKSFVPGTPRVTV